MLGHGRSQPRQALGLRAKRHTQRQRHAVLAGLSQARTLLTQADAQLRWCPALSLGLCEAVAGSLDRGLG
ncbi:MAG: hypothetical protein A2711_11315 [Burkholderiales bacterium RIFCSPHIGHO2_01_FULL_63_240]|nr:MAG: hypothetical protein A2711_11315 [Burkholderiales bacterium RIFCSPHIGHO2_01_FULL_63_240]